MHHRAHVRRRCAAVTPSGVGDPPWVFATQPPVARVATTRKLNGTNAEPSFLKENPPVDTGALIAHVHWFESNHYARNDRPIPSPKPRMDEQPGLPFCDPRRRPPPIGPRRIS